MPHLDELYGYLAVGGAILAFGSFGLPIKNKKVAKARVDPMIFQLYFSMAIFVTSWLVLSYNPFVFTFWGFAGAALWVPASVLSIFAIKYLGLSIAQALWSGLSIIVSFIWGVLYFNDEVKSIPLAIVALVVLCVGMLGLSLSSLDILAFFRSKFEGRSMRVHHPPAHLEYTSTHSQEGGLVNTINTDLLPNQHNTIQSTTNYNQHNSVSLSSSSSSSATSFTTHYNNIKEDVECTIVNEENREMELEDEEDHKTIRGRMFGFGCATVLGLMNGSMLVPLRLAPKDASGINYIISFAIGVLAITPVLAIIYFIFKRQLPVFHVRVTLIPGAISGVLWNIGNFCSIYATLYLGLTIGFPLTQVALLLSGVYGIVLFKELQTPLQILQFFTFAIVIIAGSLLLGLFG